MGGVFNIVFEQMERSTAGSEETARRVMAMRGADAVKNALFFGDDVFTPQLIAKETGASVLASFYEDHRAAKAAELGLDARTVGAYELAATEGGWDLIWYNGLTEPDGVSTRLEQLRDCLASGGTAVFRTLCWLIEPSLDTKSYVEHRFGRPVPLDEVLREAKEQRFEIKDFYIAPKSDWRRNFYEPMSELVNGIKDDREKADDSDVEFGIGEINKEMYMFELHSEEYSFVYYVLKAK